MPSAFRSSPDQFWNKYQAWQKEVEERFSRVDTMDPNVKRSILRSAPNNADLLNALPYKIREELMSRFRNEVLSFNEGYIGRNFSTIGRGGGGGIVGMFAPGAGVPTDHPLARFLRDMSFTWDPTQGAGPEAFTFGRNIPRAELARAQMAMGTNPIKAGQSVFVFDTETLGLATDTAAVREVSGVTMKRTVNGFQVDVADVMTSHLDVGRAAFGAMYDQKTGKMQRMDRFIRTIAGGGIHAPAGDGTEFMRAILPMLQEMDKADFIAGHNVAFDIGQVITNATKTSPYLNGNFVDGVNVTSLVDSVLAKIRQGAVLDTRTMLRQYFGADINLAPEFSAISQPRAFSLENVMLETNLGNLLEEDMPGFLGRMGKAQHQADVDTVITAKLVDYMSNNKLRLGRLGATGDAVEMALRKKVLTSYAPTPVSNIADISHIAPGIFRQLMEEGGDSLQVREVLTGREVDIKGRNADELYRELIDSPNLMGSAKVTPMEQHIAHTRQFFDEVDAPKSMVDNIGRWGRFSRQSVPFEGILSRLGVPMKSADMTSDKAFARFQKEMAEAGMPFAGLSLEERILTGTIAQAASKKSTLHDMLVGTPEENLAKYGDDLGITRFATRDKFFQTKVTTIPFDVIMRAQNDEVISTAFGSMDRPQMLGLSTVESSKSVNLMLEMNENQANDLMDWLGRSIHSDANPELKGFLKSRGLTSEAFGEIKNKFIDEKGYKYGINVGYIDGAAGRQAYGALTNILQGLTRDMDKIPFRVAFMSNTMIEEGKGIIRAGAATLDRFMTGEQRGVYNRDLSVAAKRAEKLSAEIPNNMAAVRAATTYMTGNEQLAKFAENTYNIIKKRGPLVAGAAALVFGGYYGYKRHKRQQEYDESLESMSYESDSDYNRYRTDMGLAPAPAYRRMDPLLTAGVVGNAHNNAIGHHRMGPTKDLGLFSGIG